MKTPPEAVWKLLVEAENWSSYFASEDQVKILTGGAGTGARNAIQRVTVGFPMSLVVTECEPLRRLAWATTVDGDETGSSAYHGWVITPTDHGCHMLTEETQQGPSFLDELWRKHPGDTLPVSPRLGRKPRPRSGGGSSEDDSGLIALPI
ncbi:SRPBCC domain-containing protein [Mesorhizobium sp. M0051]|uniref:SRPBCC family protein n=1 Tax=unclassified Mesorhizobium TaxID=325217 RepID=UPI001FDA360C|nr:SRPBCC domain-containing protein [Mesorhizobium sp. LNHC252B00]